MCSCNILSSYLPNNTCVVGNTIRPIRVNTEHAYYYRSLSMRPKYRYIVFSPNRFIEIRIYNAYTLIHNTFIAYIVSKRLKICVNKLYKAFISPGGACIAHLKLQEN